MFHQNQFPPKLIFIYRTTVSAFLGISDGANQDKIVKSMLSATQAVAGRDNCSRPITCKEALHSTFNAGLLWNGFKSFLLKIYSCVGSAI